MDHGLNFDTSQVCGCPKNSVCTDISKGILLALWTCYNVVSSIKLYFGPELHDFGENSCLPFHVQGDFWSKLVKTLVQLVTCCDFSVFLY